MAIRVGIAGVGFMGKTHMSVYAEDKRAQVTAFCDFDPSRTSGSAEKGGGNIGGQQDLPIDRSKINAYQQVEDLIADPNVDVIDICLPTFVHAKYIIMALKAGKHVLCEKPLTIDMKEAQSILKAARASKGVLMAAHCMRFWPEWAWLKEAVASKRYGKVHSAVFRRFSSTPGWAANNWTLQPKLSGSALFDMHIHDTDYIRHVFGDPKAVFSVGSSKTSPGGFDHVVTNYLYKNPKLLVSAEGGWNADPTYGFTMRYTVVFDKATADFDIGREGQTLLLHKAGAKAPEVVKTSPRNGWQEEIRYFIDCLASGKKPTVVTPADACKSVALLHKELESILKRKPINA
jgi:predicted dehydrogenase